MHFSPTSILFLLHRSKYILQQPPAEHSAPLFFPSCEAPCFTTTQNEKLQFCIFKSSCLYHTRRQNTRKWISPNCDIIVSCMTFYFHTNFIIMLYFLDRVTKFSPKIWCWNTGGHPKFTYEALNCTALNLTWTMHSQTKVFTAKLLCAISAVLRHYTALSSNSLPMFWDNISVPCSRVKKSKRENTAWLKLIDIVFFSETCHHLIFLNKHDVSEAGHVSIFKQRST